MIVLRYAQTLMGVMSAPVRLGIFWQTTVEDVMVRPYHCRATSYDPLSTLIFL